MRFPARFAVALVAALAVVAVPSAQQTTFSTRTTLLTVDVTVLDGGGRPVPGLEPDDFEVKLDGKIQPVRVAAFLGAPAPAAPAEMTVPTLARPDAGTAESRLFVLLVDDVTIRAGESKGLFTAAERFVKGLPPSDLVGFTTTSGQIVVNPTLNRAPVLAALKRAVGEYFDPRDAISTDPFVGVYEALEIDEGMNGILADVIARECDLGSQIATSANVEQLVATNECASDVQRRARSTAIKSRRITQQQLQTYMDVMHAMRAAPGIRQLVILTSGIGLVKSSDLVPVAATAAESGVQMSVLAEVPDGTTAAGGSESRRADGLALQQMAQTMTDMSGGQFFRVAGQGDRFFTRIVQAASAVYRLGVELPKNAPAGRGLTVAARVMRPGLSAHATRHTSVPGPEPVLTTEDRLRRAVTGGALDTSVPVKLGAAVWQAEAGRDLQLAVSAAVPPGVEGPLAAMFGLTDAAGVTTLGTRTLDPVAGGGYGLTFSLPVASGEYTLRVAVADDLGNVGTAESHVSARLLSMGPFAASNLLLWRNDSAGQPQMLALEDLPAGLDIVNGRLELYPVSGAGQPTEVWVKMSLIRLVGNSASSVAEFRVAPVEKAGMLHADVAIPVRALPPGTYLLRAVVTADGKEIGTVARGIKK